MKPFKLSLHGAFLTFGLATSLMMTTFKVHADVPLDSSPVQLATARYIAAQIRVKLETSTLSTDEREASTRRLGSVVAQIAVLVPRLPGETLSLVEQNDLKQRPATGSSTRDSRSSGRQDSGTTSEPAPKAKPVVVRNYIWELGLTGRKLNYVRVLDVENGQARVADAMDDKYYRTDTIRRVKAENLMQGELQEAYADTLTTRGLFGSSQTIVIVLDIVGDHAFVADYLGRGMIRNDTIRVVELSALQSTPLHKAFLASAKMVDCEADFLTESTVKKLKSDQ